MVVKAYDEVIADGFWDFVEEGYAHVRIFVEGRDIGVVAGFGEEGQGETAPFVWRLGLNGSLAQRCLYWLV
jgi:hypothetical protein